MQLLVYIIIMVVTMIISDLTRPIPKGPKRPGLDDFQFPTADATRKVPVIWGKPMLRGLNVTWFGDLRTEKITKKIKGLFSSKKQTIGWRFNVGLHMAFCVSNGDTRLLKIEIGRETAWTGNLASGRSAINQPTMFGGDEEEGGISGSFDWCPGGASQGQNDYLRAVMSILAPAYRSTARIVWRGGYLGNSKYIKEWAIQAQRLPSALGSGYHDINGEANGAEMLYEILTNRIWGLGATSLDIQSSTFLKAAATLHGETFGLSMVWDGSKSLRDIADDILAHIDGVMYVNVLTGKWELILNRASTDAEKDAMLEFTEKDIELETFSRPTLDETVNEVRVFWTESGETTKWPAVAHDLGLFQVHDKQFVSTDITYGGITSYALAAKVATRDMGQLSYPLVKVAFRTNRKAYGLKPGAKFKFSWGPLEIQSMVCVVLGIDYGTLEDNVISVEAVQDLYSLGLALYDAGGGSGWVPPSRNPLPPTVYRMEFTPYWLLLTDEEVPNPESAVPMLMVEAPSPTHLSYDVKYTDPSLGGVYAVSEDTQPFTPTAVLAYDYLETQGQDTSGTLIVRSLNGLTGITVPATGDVQYLGSGLLVIDSEWMAVIAAVERPDGSWLLSVQRGLLDSTISRHLAGAKVWFVGEALGRTPTQLNPFANGTYSARLISLAIGGRLNEANAPVASIQASGGGGRPLFSYPVRGLTVNGSKTPVVVPNGNLVLVWKDRNRAAENTIYFQDTATTVGRESDVTYRCYLYSDSGTLLLSSGDLTSNTYTFLSAGLVGGIPASGYVQVEAYRAGKGAGQRATIWFGLSVDYSGVADSAPQRLIEEAGPWFLWRMSD